MNGGDMNVYCWIIGRRCVWNGHHRPGRRRREG
nr:MAG TPA: hypothetical protein [Caudoviricetes sp.]